MTDKEARYRAIRCINNYLGTLVNSSEHGIVPEWEGNQFTSEADKKKIRQEFENLRWQLHRREIKLQREIFT